MNIYIKNMVCPRCKMAVKNTLDELGILYNSIELGEVNLNKSLAANEKVLLADKLENLGFQILEGKSAELISRIKSLIIQQIHYSSDQLTVNYSDYIAQQLNQNYHSLSRLFSEVEGITIEKFITTQRIEKVKELLFYNEQTLSEVAFELNYSSVAHLSAQFKKETGMTPTTFKKHKKFNRRTIDY